MNRSAQTCATLFLWFEVLFLVGFISIPITVFWFHWFQYAQLVIMFSFLGVSGTLAYQIGYHPIIAVILALALLLPYAGLAVVVFLFIQTRGYLKKQNYKIGLFGAKPV